MIFVCKRELFCDRDKLKYPKADTLTAITTSLAPPVSVVMSSADRVLAVRGKSLRAAVGLQRAGWGAIDRYRQRNPLPHKQCVREHACAGPKLSPPCPNFTTAVLQSTDSHQITIFLLFASSVSFLRQRVVSLFRQDNNLLRRYLFRNARLG